ncbi:MAG: hypothetical protein ACI8WB_004216 [Phenylobacterium sp.]
MSKYLSEVSGVILTSVFVSASIQAIEVNPSSTQIPMVQNAIAPSSSPSPSATTTSNVQQTLTALQSGPISDPDTFGILPQDGDILDAGTFTVTIDQSFSAGQISSAAGTVVLTGEFIISNGVTLTVNGDWDASQPTSQNQLNGTAQVVFDGLTGITRSYQAASQHYRAPSLMIQSSAADKAFFGLKIGSAATFAYDKQGFLGSNIQGGNVHLNGFSSGYIHDGYNTTATKDCIMPNVLFTNSGQFMLRYSAADNGSCDLENLTILSPTVTNAFRTAGSYGSTTQSALFNLNGLSVDGGVEYYARSEFQMSDWVVKDLAATLSVQGWQNVDSWLLFNADTIPVGSALTSNVYFRGEKYNPHGYSMGTGYMNVHNSRTIDSVVFDFVNLDAGESGDMYMFSGPGNAGETVHISNNVALDNINDKQSSTFITFNGSNQNGRKVELNNNVVFIPLNNRAISLNEASTTPSQTISSIEDNIFWGDSSQKGYVVGSLGNTSEMDIVELDAYSNNGVYHGRNDGTHNELDLPLNYTPDAPVVTSAPHFYDDQRRLKTYGISELGLVDGTAETAFTAFVTRHLSLNDMTRLGSMANHQDYVATHQGPLAVKDMIDWIKQGFVATTTTYHNSGSDLAALGLQVTPTFTLNDADGDSIDDRFDLVCPNTPAGEVINTQGCANSELDDDGDGVSNAVDICVETTPGAVLVDQGCSQAEIEGELLGFNSWGIRGGGAMAGYSINPFAQDMRFVGTDMGTAFRSLNKGVDWSPIRHTQTTYHYNLGYAAGFGFAGAKIILHAPQGLNPVRSINAGQTFAAPASFALVYSDDGEHLNDERIVGWYSDTVNVGTIYAMTSLGLWRSADEGDHWSFVYNGGGIKGLFIDNYESGKVYIATEDHILSSTDGISFSNHHTPNGHKIHRFSGGSNAINKTLTYASDETGLAIAASDAAGLVLDEVKATYARPSHAGDEVSAAMIYTSENGNDFAPTSQFMGSHLTMAQNDPMTIYATGTRNWGRDKGTSVYVSEDAGATWAVKLLQYDWDTGFTAWSDMEFTPVGLNVGWYDGGYYTMGINQLDSNQYGGSGNFFLYGTEDGGSKWLDLTNEYKGDIATPPVKTDEWASSGLNVTSVYDLKFNPANTNDIYAAYADIHGARSIDHGATWQILPSATNSIYDYAFHPTDDNTVYMVNSTQHDWPYQNLSLVGEGGVFKSTNKGDDWTRLTPTDSDYHRQYLSIGVDTARNTIYAGSHSDGISRSTDGGVTWTKFNAGLPANFAGHTFAMDLVIPQIEVLDNGNVYALVTGARPELTAQQTIDFGLQSNQYIEDTSGATTKYYSWLNADSTGIYLLDVVNGATSWTLLRGTIDTSGHGSWDPDHQPWKRPMSFAVDPNNSDVLWLTDMEFRTWQTAATGIWKSTDNGLTWQFKRQHTAALDIAISANDSNYVVVAGPVSWRNGGMQISKDGGTNWTMDERPQLQDNGHSVALDPLNTNKVVYGYSGGGMLYGDKF